MTIQALINKIFRANQTQNNTVSWSGSNGLKSIQEDIVDTIRQRTFFTVPNTTALLSQGFNNAVLCYVQDNAFYRWEPSGIPNGTTIFPANDGGVWVQETIGDTDGTVTSIGITAPAAFTVTNSPVTTSGVIDIAANGTSAQYIKGDGTLGTLPTPTGGTVTNVSALTINSTGTDLSSTVANPTTTPVITLSVPTASAVNRGVLSPTDWSTFNGKQDAITLTTTGTSGAATLVGSTLNIPQYQSVITNPVTGTGTTNYLSKWTSSSSLNNSLVYDNGTNVLINTTTDAGYKLDVNGTTRSQGKLTITTGGAEITGNVVAYTGIQSYGQVQIFSAAAFQMFNAANNSKASFQYINANGLLLTTNSDNISGVLKGLQVSPTMVASANNNVLVGLDITPTFTNGAFTGVSNLAIRTNGNVQVRGNTTQFGAVFQVLDTAGTNNFYIRDIGDAFLKGTLWFGTLNGSTAMSSGYLSVYSGVGTGTSFITFTHNNGNVAFRALSNSVLQLNPSAGNVLVGTTTDAGYKLDVNGTARIQNTLTVSNPSYTGSGSFYQAANFTTVISGGAASENITFGPSNRIFLNASQVRAQNILQAAGYITAGTYNYGVAQVYGSGSITASGAVARGIFTDTTLVAAANNDVLVGLDITPTFTNGAFTGLTNLGLRVNSGVSLFSGNVVLNGTNLYFGSNLGNVVIRPVQTTNLQIFNNNTGATLFLNANGAVQIGQSNVTNWARFSATGHTIYGTTNTNFFTSGNVGINQGTDAGFKLDVNGTTRLRSDAVFGIGNGLMILGRNTGGGQSQSMIQFDGANGWNFAITNFASTVFLDLTNDGRFTMGNNLIYTSRDSSAVLNLVSQSRGFLKPRMTTTQRNAIATPATGLEVYNTTTNTEDYYNGTTWVSLQTTAAAVKSYGAWQDNATQTAAASNTGYGVRFDVPNITGYGVTVQADSLGNNTLIKMANAGTYNIQFSFQFENADNAEEYIYIWLRKNGETSAADIPASNTIVTIHKKSGSTPGNTVAAWNFFVEAAANDFFQIVWATTDATNVTMPFYAATGFAPSTPSTILTVNQVN